MLLHSLLGPLEPCVRYQERTHHNGDAEAITTLSAHVIDILKE